MRHIDQAGTRFEQLQHLHPFASEEDIWEMIEEDFEPTFRLVRETGGEVKPLKGGLTLAAAEKLKRALDLDLRTCFWYVRIEAEGN